MRSPVRLSLALAALHGCGDFACPGGGEDCEVPSPCEGLAFTCDAGATELYVADATTVLPGGPGAAAADGDIVLANDQVMVVLDALDHPHYLAPTGGAILDMVRRDAPNDAARHVFQATGLLPEDAIAYDHVQMLDEGDVKAVLFTGRLFGYPDTRVATRYEIRPCEPGVRVRTEIINLGPDPLSWFLTDAWYFGGRGSLPFTPGPGAGYRHPSFGLGDIMTAFREVPFLATGAHPGPSASYVEVACSESGLHGFHSSNISAVGPEPAVLYPRDGLSFERFIGVEGGHSASGGADLAFEVRRQLFDEPYVVLSGEVLAGGTDPSSIEATLVVSEGTSDLPPEERVPWTQAFPGSDGTFSVRVPADKSYVIEVRALGRDATEIEVVVGEDDVDVGPIEVDPLGEITLDATLDGVPDHVLAFVRPADDATRAASTGDFYGSWVQCAPYLGEPHGNSPACDRVLVDGPTTVALPAGTYDVFASVGPFSTLAAARGVVVSPGTGQTVTLDLRTLDVQPEGTLSGDFHVHGGPSFDAGIGDVDRTRALLASGLQVIATTEHDTVWDYADALATLGAEGRVAMITGTESTGHILYKYRTDGDFPQVIGHWNFWPVAFDPRAPYRGAGWDELVEPGALMHRHAEAGWDETIGVAELNHPIGALEFGRDLGWATALGLDLTQPLKREDDGTGQAVFLRTPEGSSYGNADYHVQEVMNGSSNDVFLAYRAFWFYLLNQGVVRGGVANSDSHTLTENVVGTPRTLVFTDQTVDDFDVAAFDQSMRDGRMLGTNGPVLLAQIEGDGATWAPGIASFEPPADASLVIDVSAAPWVPVDEVRIVVNGAVARTLTDLSAPADPFGDEGIDRLHAEIPLAELLPPGGGDAWIVVEAGSPLRAADDLNCDGVPDTTDNNGDGAIDWRDVAALTEDPGVDCLEDVGPLGNMPDPAVDTPLDYFRAVTPGGFPLAFTNPFVLDRDGGGFQGVTP